MKRSIGIVSTALIALAGLAAALAPAASADVPILNYGLLPSNTQAGGHPDLQVAFYLKINLQQQQEDGANTKCNCSNARIVKIHGPGGLLARPQALPRCTLADFGASSCPVDSQVGFVHLTVPFENSIGAGIGVNAPVYNIVPRTGEPGLVGFSGFGVTVFETVEARTGSDYGLNQSAFVEQLLPLYLFNQIYFGVPAAPGNDDFRFKFPGLGTANSEVCDSEGNLVQPAVPEFTTGPNPPDVPPPDPYAPLSGPDSFDHACFPFLIPNFTEQVPTATDAPEIPFIVAPTTCDVPLESSIDVLSYDGGETHDSASYPSTTGCDQLTFNPSLAAKPTTTDADTPSGLDIDLTVPQTQSPTAPSPSEIKETTVTLPEGFSINPNTADGKVACEDANALFGSEEQGFCPEFAKIGTLQIVTALLPGPLPGYVYLGEPRPGDRYRIFLIADGFGLHIKLRGTIKLDPATGQVVASFKDLPQAPFEQFKMHIFGSERGVLATPTECGTYAVKSVFVPWDDLLPDQSSTQFFVIDSGPGGTPCPTGPRPFNPSFEAGSTGNTAGAHTSFSVELTRPDGDQFLTGLDVHTPPGFSGVLKGIPYCSEAAISLLKSSFYAGLAELASPSCPAASQVGTVSAGAGAGSKPLFVDGKVYWAGPYKGAPFSLVIVIPAVSGPYDLGNVAVRVPLHVNPVTGRVSALSDPLPQILEGIPLRARQIRVNLNRENFVLNPTNCDPFSVNATAKGDQGATATLTSQYQVANCATLPFDPKLNLKLRGSSKRRGHPALRSVALFKRGANLAVATVAMPKSLLLDQAHIDTICTRVQFAADSCPSGSVVGSAIAETPILDQPLKGTVYLRSSSHTLPDLVVDLRGQVDFELVGRIDKAKTGGLRATFEAPDVPVSRFVLDLLGGNQGLLFNSENLCKSPPKAFVRLVGQNGKRISRRTAIETSCAGKRKGKRARHGKARLSSTRKVG
jgi:hypothetical protein